MEKDIFGKQFALNTKRVLKYRHDLHMIPEPGLEEKKTSAYIQRKLTAARIPFKAGIAKTGVVAHIKGNGRAPAVLLRADMDGIAVAKEETGLAYSSRHSGYMHACGHDAHTAMLLTAGHILNSARRELPGDVILVFQPAEEGKCGGKLVVDSGAINWKNIGCAVALHMWGVSPGHTFGWNTGPAFAFADKFEAAIIGRGGHGSAPSQTLDPIPVAAQAVNTINTITSRTLNIHKQAVVSVCTVNGGSAFNVIPDRVDIKGTVRTYEAPLRNRIAAQLKRIFVHTARASGLKAEFQFHKFYPVLINDRNIAELGRDVAQRIFGKKAVKEMQPTMGGEDFSYFLQKVPGAMFLLGSSRTKKPTPHHNSLFDIDESSMIMGVEFLCKFVYRFQTKAQR